MWNRVNSGVTTEFHCMSTLIPHLCNKDRKIEHNGNFTDIFMFLVVFNHHKVFKLYTLYVSVFQ